MGIRSTGSLIMLKDDDSRKRISCEIDVCSARGLLKSNTI
jgi:hypothetical protein